MFVVQFQGNKSGQGLGQCGLTSARCGWLVKPGRMSSSDHRFLAYCTLVTSQPHSQWDKKSIKALISLLMQNLLAQFFPFKIDHLFHWLTSQPYVSHVKLMIGNETEKGRDWGGGGLKISGSQFRQIRHACWTQVYFCKFAYDEVWKLVNECGLQIQVAAF